MSGIPNSALVDLVRTTLPNLPNLEFEKTFTFQNYEVCNRWFKQDKVEIESGTSIERNIVLDDTGNARHVRLYQKTPVNVGETQVKITAPWCQVQTYWSVERRELLRNRPKARFVNLLQSRRFDGTVSLADLLEARAWMTPLNASDDLNPRGIPYWISYLANGASSAGGFTGQTIRYGDGTTTTTKGGIDASTTANARWRNYAATYSAVNGDFVKRMAKAFHACRFKPPMLAKDLGSGPASNFRIYMGLETLVEYEDLATKQNDNLGRDLAPFHGNTVFKNVPIIYTPQIDDMRVIDGGSNSFNPEPVYAINHANFFPIVLSGDWMREDGPHTDVEQHNVFTTFIDGSYQYFCKNVRHAGFTLHKVIPAS